MKKWFVVLLYLSWSIAAQCAYPIGFTWRKTTNGVQTAFTAISTDYKCAIGIAWVSTERTGSSNIQDQTEIGAGIPTDFQGQFVIPSLLEEEVYYVTEIGYKAFYDCSGITSVSIPNTITYIDCFAFRGCSSLSSVTIPGSVVEIDGNAFAKCKNLSSVTLNEGLQKIGESAFFGCSSLQSIYIPSSVTSIGAQAFSGGYYSDTHEQLNSNLTRVEVNWSSPIKISSGTFSNSANATLYVPRGTLELYKNAEGWKDFGIIKEVAEIISFADAKVKEICVSNWDLDGDGELSKEEAASVTDLGIVFKGNTTITFFDELQFFIGLEAIPPSAFSSCTHLSKVTIPNSVKSIGAFAFYGCYGLNGPLTIPNSVTSIGYGAFEECSHISGVLTIPNSVMSIGDYAFSKCESITDLLFSSNSVISIGKSAFKRCYNLKGSLTIPNSVTTIGEEAFYECNLTSLTIPNSVTTIGKEAFSHCELLHVVKSEIVFPFDIGYDVFDDIADIATLQVPFGTKDQYIAKNWSYPFVKISEDGGITSFALLIKSDSNGYGSVTYNGNRIFMSTHKFWVDEGTDATITLSPFGGKRIKSVKVNNQDVTSSIINNAYTISNIKRYTIVEVAFEAIPATTYSLSITASGNGSVTYNSKSFRNSTQSFTVNEGASATVSFTPDNGYRIASVKVNDTDVTSTVSSNKYTISNITQNTTLAVTFEVVPATTYSLSITASGNGSATYNSTSFRNNTLSFTVNEGTSATVSFTPDNGYRIASVKVNDTDVTSSVSSNEYTISNITANTTLAVTFEAIPVTTYSLNITALGNGSASYNGTSIRNNTQSFTVNEGTNVPVTFSSDSGYRIASVKVNDTDVTTNVANNRYTIENIADNTTLSVTFEEIPATTYSLNVSASGNGSVMYNDITIRNESRSYTVNEGDYASFIFTPDNGYRIGSVIVNNSDVTYLVSNNQYSINSITTNTTVDVTFEAIPVTTYSLSITASGNGSVNFDGTTVKNRTQSFTLNEGSDATITFNPDNGNSVSSVKVNGSDITSQLSGNRYTINNITANTTLEVSFQEDVNALTVDGLNYTVTSQSDKTVTFTGGDFGLVLTVPATITQNGTTWKVTGIDQNALKNNTELAAIIWNPEAVFTATVSNPNLLLYVKSAQYAPSTINNVVVNGTANSITLVDAASGNNFYCPQAFTAQSISYTHHYSMMTGIGESRGWETIALPFDVQKVAHASKGTIVPFTQWSSGNTAKPFWLYELKSNGFVEASGIKANTPYIISMPNNPQYADQYQLAGNVTFSAENTTVKVSDNMQQPKYNDRTFVSNFQGQPSNLGYYALNVSNDYFTNNSGMTDGSRFVLNMRKILPFEAYMTSSSSSAPESIGIFDDMTTEIQEIPNDMLNTSNSVYDLQGRKIEKTKLAKGLYIVNGQKVIIK